MNDLRHASIIAAVLVALTGGCDRGSTQGGTTAATTASGRAAPSASGAASASAAPAATASVTPLPSEPAPTSVAVDLAAMQWKDLKSGKSLALVDTDLGKCGLAGWHLPLPKGIVLSPLVLGEGKGCSAKNMPGPPGTQLMVAIGGLPLSITAITNVKDITFEASDGYILEQETKGTPPFYPRVERDIAGAFTSCSLTYVDFDTARAAYALCRKLEKSP